MSERDITRTVRLVETKALDGRAERRAYWASRSIEERILEVESLRRMWIEVTGDPGVPIQRVVQRRSIRR
jgi:hypothetical protein